MFLIFCYLVTFIKFLLLMFLPEMYHSLVGDVEYLWPDISMSLFGVDFDLAILGNALERDAETGAFLTSSGLAYTLANFTAILFGELINFPLQRNITFKSHGPLPRQIFCHFAATIVVMLMMNLFTCVWNPIVASFISNEALRNTVKNIVTTIVTGGVSMVIIFAVDKAIFSPNFGKNIDKTN